MYRVIGKGPAILTFIFLALGIAAAGSAAARYLPAAAAERQLPIYSVETSEKAVALGINCAWDDSDIDEILALLDAGGTKATFFIVGDWCDKYPDAVARIADAGHELGSHSDTHPDMTTLSREQIERQLGESRRNIESASGKPVRLFRAPSGAYNNLTVTTARSLGWEVIQWSNDVNDTPAKRSTMGV